MKHLLIIPLLLLTACEETKPVSLLTDNKAMASEIIAAPDLPKFRLHKITLAVDKPNDLKVKQGSAVSEGQIIADQEDERDRLLQRKAELMLAVDRLKKQLITEPQKPLEPLKPKPVPALTDLGDVSYQQYEAAIEKAKKEVDRATAELDLKNREIDFIKGVEGIDPAIIEHELAAVAQLKAKVKDAAIEVSLTEGKLLTARQERQQKEYQHSLDAARRIEEANTAQSFYQHQVAENLIAFQRQSADYERELRERDYRTTQTKLQLSGIDDNISKLSTIRSPYSGTVKRVKFINQTDNKLNIELSIVIPVGDSAIPESTSSSNTTRANTSSSTTAPTSTSSSNGSIDSNKATAPAPN